MFKTWEVIEIVREAIPRFSDICEPIRKPWPPWPPYDPVPWYLIAKVLDEKNLATLVKLRMECSQKVLEAQLKFNEQLVQIQTDFQKEVSRLFGKGL